MKKKIYYEQPLNERIRSLMRLEFLFHQVEYSLEGTSVWNSRASLETIISIQTLVSRSDLKTEILKELERHTSNLARLEQNPEVDKVQLSRILDELEMLIDRIYANNVPFGSELKNNEFINSIKQRISVPGGTSDLDLPAYHYWLQQPSEVRIQDLHDWLKPFHTLRKAIDLILRLIRQSAHPRMELAEAGFYQRNLDANNPCQILRIALPNDSAFFPEISGGKHRFTIRFLKIEDYENRPKQTKEDIEFELACCII